MKKRGLIFLAAAALSVATLITGCSSGGDAAFEDTKWTLASYGAIDDPQPVIEGTEVTATFESDGERVAGSAGCNSYFGGYSLDDGLTVGALGSTEMYCMDPEGVMEQETDYLKILGKAESYIIENGSLTIRCGTDVLIYTATEEAAP